MKKKCIVHVTPYYEYNGLTEKQYKLMRAKILDYPSSFTNDGIQVTSYGGCSSYGRGYHFVLHLDEYVRNRECFTVDRKDIDIDDTLSRKVNEVLAYMDNIAEELEKIIEENGES